MRTRSIAVVLLAGVLFFGACSSSDSKTSVPGSSSSTTVDTSHIDKECLGNELKERQQNGEFTVDDLGAWLSGGAPDGPVQKAADEILNSGKCKK